MIDVSVAAAKARAARYAASWEPETGPAGVEKTRRETPLLAERHELKIKSFYVHIPARERAAFRASVLARLSGLPNDGAVAAAVYAMLAELGFDVAKLRALGLVQNNNRRTGRSKEAAMAPIE
jgi:hypothetical protein